MLTTVPQQDTGDLDQPQVVGGLLLVAHQNGAAFREPAQCALHHPSPPRVTLLPGVIFLLLAHAPYVGGCSRGTPPPPRPPVPCRSPCPGTDAGTTPPRARGARPPWRRAWLRAA